MRAGGGVPAVEWGVRAGGGVRGDCGTPASRACGTAAGGTAFLSPAPLPGCLQPPERGNWVNRLSKKAVTFSVAKELVQGAPPASVWVEEPGPVRLFPSLTVVFLPQCPHILLCSF